MLVTNFYQFNVWRLMCKINYIVYINPGCDISMSYAESMFKIELLSKTRTPSDNMPFCSCQIKECVMCLCVYVLVCMHACEFACTNVHAVQYINCLTKQLGTFFCISNKMKKKNTTHSEQSIPHTRNKTYRTLGTIPI